MTFVLIKGSPSVISKGVECLLTMLPTIGSTLKFVYSNEKDGQTSIKAEIIISIIGSRGGYRQNLPQVSDNIAVKRSRNIIYYHEDRLSTALKFLTQGAHGFVSQQSDSFELTKCFREVLAHRHFFCQRSARSLFNLYLSVIVPLDHPQLSFFLTSREREILRLLLKGYAVKQIGFK